MKINITTKNQIPNIYYNKFNKENRIILYKHILGTQSIYFVHGASNSYTPAKLYCAFSSPDGKKWELCYSLVHLSNSDEYTYYDITDSFEINIFL